MDPRFDTRKDPRFKRIPSKALKVTLDDRFSKILKEDSFLTVVDPKTGRKKLAQQNLAELHRLYKSEENTERTKSTDSGESDASVQFSWNEESCSDTESTESEGDYETQTSVWDAHDHSIPMSVSTSSRLAILGCDWNCVSSQDLYVLLSSYAQNVGKIKKVAIYISNFGKKRLEDEKLHGPSLNMPSRAQRSQKSAKHQTDSDEADTPYDPKDEKIIEAVRKYHKEQSRYYFAVVECDNAKTANFLYEELEGVDCDFTVDDLDIRFIPESHPPFTDEFPSIPRCIATKETTHGYEPPESFISALKHSKARLIWDETPVTRTRRLRQHFTANEMGTLDLKDYLASGSDDHSDNSSECSEPIQDEAVLLAASIDGIELPQGIKRTQPSTMEHGRIDTIEAYRAKLLGHEGQETRSNVKSNGALKIMSDIELVVEDGKTQESKDTFNKTSITPWGKYIEKCKQKKERKKEKKKLTTIEVEENGAEKVIRKHNIQKGISSMEADGLSPSDDTHRDAEATQCRKTKRQKLKEKKSKKSLAKKESSVISFTNDERFKNILLNPKFAIDTTNPKFKMSNAYRDFLKTKVDKRKETQTQGSSV